MTALAVPPRTIEPDGGPWFARLGLSDAQMEALQYLTLRGFVPSHTPDGMRMVRHDAGVTDVLLLHGKDGTARVERHPTALPPLGNAAVTLCPLRTAQGVLADVARAWARWPR